MVSSGMFRRVALVRTDVSKELSASFIRVTRIGELGTTLAVTSNRRTPSSSETSVLTRSTRRNIREDTILHSHRCENLKSYMKIGNAKGMPIFRLAYL
jgi:3'-phosphoadenosine 5'-phosphosulfate sulfotransferase